MTVKNSWGRGGYSGVKLCLVLLGMMSGEIKSLDNTPSILGQLFATLNLITTVAGKFKKRFTK